jgi:hypothetical protein
MGRMQTVDPVITMQMDNVLVACPQFGFGEQVQELGKMYYHLLNNNF